MHATQVNHQWSSVLQQTSHGLLLLLMMTDHRPCRDQGITFSNYHLSIHARSLFKMLFAMFVSIHFAAKLR